MKKVVALSIILLVQFSCTMDDLDFSPYGKYPDYYLFKGRLSAYGNSTILVGNNNLIICGNAGDSITVFKTSVKGAMIWRKEYYSEGKCSLTSIVETSKQELFICGETSKNYSNSRADVLLIKVNSKGDTIWTRSYGGKDFDYGTNMIRTSDGNLLIAGKTHSFGSDSYGDIYLIKVNYNGEVLWMNSYYDPGQEFPTHLTETVNGEYLVTGNNQEPGVDIRNELYLLKVDVNGKKLWDRKMGSGDWKWAFSTIEISGGDLMTCGQNTSAGYTQVLIVKTNQFGHIIWERRYGEPFLSEIAYSIKQNQDKTYTVSGSSYNVKTGKYEIILLKINEYGNEDWFKRFGCANNAVGLNLLKDNNNNNILTGNYNGNIFMSIVKDNGDFR